MTIQAGNAAAMVAAADCSSGTVAMRPATAAELQAIAAWQADPASQPPPTGKPAALAALGARFAAGVGSSADVQQALAALLGVGAPPPPPQ